MKVGISLMRGAYTPEAYAYEKYLMSKGVSVQLDYAESLCGDNDLNVFFMGLRVGRKKNKALEIHEYQSLSTAPFAKIKDHIKSTFNRKPQGRIFLNDIVKANLNFGHDQVPYICRDMGVDKSFYQKPSINPDFDIIYSGSINGRPGLVEQMYKLAEDGFKIIVVGESTPGTRNIFSKFGRKVFFTGRVTREELPEIYRNCRAGLNFTPDIYPFNLQTSTKTLEYLASGLIVLTNRYKWSESFFYGQERHCVFLGQVNQMDDIKNQEDHFIGIEKFEWSKILSSADLHGFIKRVIR
ncbi:hypothetical protein D3C85_540390 [compost metagenome]